MKTSASSSAPQQQPCCWEAAVCVCVSSRSSSMSSSSSSSSSYRSQHCSSSFRPGGSSPGEPSSAYRDFRDEANSIPLRHSQCRESFRYAAPVSARPASLGTLRSVGDMYQMSADVSQFEPQDVVVTTYNYHIVIHAEQVAEDGTVSNTFTHTVQLPEDMDPLSVSCALSEAGMLVISVKRNHTADPPPAYHSEMQC
ncbi:Heat shock protein beta-7 [Acipenser ruthenus]|uniref:Heat shock protein beta-7 n=1 Tax=Acipenser ruthenus TaxID=7906 RepID=A0A662YT64_ACIRT|nr:Heat shock protein beta-7 [Acipenser ruthenus]